MGGCGHQTNSGQEESCSVLIYMGFFFKIILNSVIATLCILICSSYPQVIFPKLNTYPSLQKHEYTNKKFQPVCGCLNFSSKYGLTPAE